MRTSTACARSGVPRSRRSRSRSHTSADWPASSAQATSAGRAVPALGPTTAPSRGARRASAEDGVGDGEHLRRGPVVASSRDDVGAEAGREVEDVADVGGPEPVDRLGVVAHRGEAGAAGGQPGADVGLEGVGVLVLVDEHVVEPARRAAAPTSGVASSARQQQQQVVVVEDLGARACGRCRRRRWPAARRARPRTTGSGGRAPSTAACGVLTTRLRIAARSPWPGGAGGVGRRRGARRRRRARRGPGPGGRRRRPGRAR